MTGLWLPTAVRDEHVSRVLPFTDTTHPKGVLHTTESSGRPSYAGWSIAPHLTVVPVPNVRVIAYQHIPFNQASFSLKNLPGGVETNRDDVYQIELVGTCDPATASRDSGMYYWPQADDKVLYSLAADVLIPMGNILGIPFHAVPFQAFPASFGAGNQVRMSPAVWDNYRGWCGHQHVPENVHGDPGLFPWARMVGLVTRTPPVSRDGGHPSSAPPFPLPAGEYFGAGGILSGHHLIDWQRRMHARGWTITADNVYGSQTYRVAKAFQTEKGITPANGRISAKTWAAAWLLPITR